MNADLLRAHVAFAHRSNLRACRPLAPLPAQEHIIRAAVVDARRWGKRLPAALRIYTVERPRESPDAAGETVCFPDGRIEVFLDVNHVMPLDLASTTLHECSHVHDFTLGDFDLLAGEQRALEFAPWALARRW